MGGDQSAAKIAGHQNNNVLTATLNNFYQAANSKSPIHTINELAFNQDTKEGDLEDYDHNQMMLSYLKTDY